jgi:Flp pilus assembly protein TadD
VPRGDASRASDRDRAGWLASEALVAVEAGHLEDARQQLEVAAQLAPDLTLVHVYAANVAYLGGDLLEASAALERAVALEPDNQELRANLARLRARVGRE